LLIALMGGIVLGSRLPGFTSVCLIAALIAAGFCLAGLFRGKPALWMPVLFFVSIGYLSIQPWLSPRLPADHIQYHTGTQRWIIHGHIDTPPLHKNNRTRFNLRVISLAADGQIQPASGRLRVTVVGEPPEIAVGDRIRFKGRMRAITNFKNPGGFDYKRYLAFKGIYASAYVRGDRISLAEKSAPAGVIHILNRLRREFSGLVEKSGSPDVQSVLQALIIGDRSRISETTRQRFNRAGVGHLLAISGLHVGIVAAVAFYFWRWLMAWFKPLLWRAWTRKAAALLSLVPVIGYGVVAGLSPSTQRAVLMVAVFLLAFLMAKEQDSLNTLALAALVILVVDPPSLFSISFQLSFVSVFAIMFGFASIQNVRIWQVARNGGSWPGRLALKPISFLLVSAFAVWGSLPLVAFYFNQVSVVGLAANLLVVPLIGFMTVPLGLAALCLSQLSPALAGWCLQGGAVVLALALDIITYFAGLPFAAVKTVTPNLVEIACFYIMSGALLTILVLRPAGSAGRPPAALSCQKERRARDGAPAGRGVLKAFFRRFAEIGGRHLSARKLAGIAAILALVVLAADGCYWLYQRFWHPHLRVTVIDVGEGSAALLEIPGGSTIMIDGGGFSDDASFDVGARILAPFLWRKKIKTVDLLILSHPNSDHLNGLIYLAEHFNVKTLWTNDEPRTTVGYHRLMDVCTARGIISPVYAGMARRHRIGGVQLDLLYPPRDFLDRQKVDKWRNTNNNSLVVKVTYGDVSFLFSGDIMSPAETELVDLAGERLSSTVLIAPHHGSRTSSSRLFLRKVAPEIVVVSCGRNSRFNFPHPAVLQRYKDAGAGIFRTDLHGAVHLSTGGRQVLIRSQSRGRGHEQD